VSYIGRIMIHRVDMRADGSNTRVDATTSSVGSSTSLA
jgi:hypothetical protein